jgi:hypothetical protein
MHVSRFPLFTVKEIPADAEIVSHRLMTRAGMLLRSCRNYRFCLAVAWAACLFVPIGTLLGGLTISILKRPATQRLFAGAGAPAAAGPAKL